MQFWNQYDFGTLLEKARHSPRMRAAQPLHSSQYTGMRCILNAMLPGTYIQPHKHEGEGNNEMWGVLKGTIHPIEFTETGGISRSLKLAAKDSVPFVDMQEGTFHTLLVAEPTVIFEVTKGPYNPETYKVAAPWAPTEENIREARIFLRKLEKQIGL